MAADKFRVGYLRVMDDAQAIVAQEGGYYKKAGLDSELIEFKSGTDLIKAIVGGQLDIGVLGFTNAVAWASKGADLKVVGGAQQGYHSLIVRDDSGIKDIAGLKGKTLASQAEGSTADVVLKGVVLKEGKLTPDDVNVMGVSPAVAVQSLVGKRVDAAFLFEPYDRIAQLVAPVKQIYEVGQAWPFPCMVVITSGETLAKRKDDVWKALDAQNQAIDLLQKQPAQASADRVLLHRRADAQDPDARRAAARDGDRRGHQHPGVHAQADRQGHAPHAGDRRHPAGPGFAQDARRQAV